MARGIHFRVSGDGHRHREFRVRPFGHRELAPGIRRLKAELLTPEWPTAVAVTRHLRMDATRSARSADPTSMHRDNYVVTRSRPHPNKKAPGVGGWGEIRTARGSVPTSYLAEAL